MGETVRLNAVISNRTANGQPMTLARLGLPGGLAFQNWQLKELREKGQIAFFETRAREVILYFRDLKPSEVKTIGIDLVAAVPGRYTGPASSAYLYYNDAAKHWAAPLAVSIAP
jgi:alpha-2-macroglobulin-like protein